VGQQGSASGSLLLNLQGLEVVLREFACFDLPRGRPAGTRLPPATRARSDRLTCGGYGDPTGSAVTILGALGPGYAGWPIPRPPWPA
jgi:hypothetical protein